MTLEDVKTIADVSAIGTAVGVFTSVLPTIAALFTVVWLGIRIWESETVQKIVGRKPDAAKPLPPRDD